MIIDSHGKEHVVRLSAGARSHHGRTGLVSHDTILGRQPGLRIVTDDGRRFLCLRPTLEDYILKVLKRRTQIIYPKDLGSLLIEANIYPGARVLEAGIGSAAATLVLRRWLGPEGRLVSCERREEFALHCRQTLDEFESLYGGILCNHEIKIGDVYDGIDEKDLDAILLDLPEPQNAEEAAAEALRINGVLLCWIPTALQVFELARALQTSPAWGRVQIRETLLRPWHVGVKSARPAHRMVGHTGFLVSGRRVEEIAVP